MCVWIEMKKVWEKLLGLAFFFSNSTDVNDILREAATTEN